MLLIDENLSYKLAARLAGDFPGTIAVAKAPSLGEGTQDPVVWEYAKTNNLVLVTKDKDFVDYWKRFGPPPKVIRLEIGNSRLSNVEQMIINNKNKILHFISSSNDGLLMLKGF
ncbi:DUF5615 family PIN-like protein [Hahella aquimaris]|uniref:DUF5615 family PIN-like protein n=1 Tax=Hahella sp. HNIBRBA332 TaxID=3015983 RepID=UPI00273B908F|nr:DUF5615 family PIN-like protein [Hahella sp. HNIBRBA332]WLQ14385.1 DUF5615 family PIN-like protein [Hahella sp. HNIBRBA332]